LALAAGDHAAAAQAAERSAEVSLDAGTRIRAGLVAGALAADHLQDPDRALAAFRHVLLDDPGHPEVVDRVTHILAERGDQIERASILSTRAAAETDPARAAQLHFQLAQLHRDLGDPERVREHLDRAL